MAETFNIGDRVQIFSEEEAKARKPLSFVSNMYRFCGRTATIKSFTDASETWVELEFDDPSPVGTDYFPYPNDWSWSIFMIKHITDNNNTRLKNISW